MSKEVKRYNFDVDKFGSPRAYESEHGRWIKRDDYKALLAERDSLKKDAERYRFARHIDNDMIMLSALQRVSGDALDEVIDAAQQGEQP